MGLQRARERGELDRIEQEALAFFQRTRARYLELARQDKKIHIIDASQTPEQVQMAIHAALEQALCIRG